MDATLTNPRIEVLDTLPAVAVDEAEYRRLLGYPHGHQPSERAVELAAWVRGWYAAHGKPWRYLREVELEVTADALRLDGTEFRSKQLHRHLLATASDRALVVAVSAGAGCEEQARALWEASKPDEYFFLEMFGSAVVEHLMANLSGRICDLAERAGWRAVRHYSPGYTGWEVSDQGKLFELITRGMRQPFPEPLHVLPSGMLRPKKSLLAVVGLSRTPAERGRDALQVPCESCGFSPCAYRRRPYRHALESKESGREATATTPPARERTASLTMNARYSVSVRALEKWSAERVTIETRPDGGISARFRFDGTTCSSMGQPLAFDYTVELGPAGDGYPILRATCRPAPDDEGYRSMCAYLANADALMEAIASEQPLVGQPLDDVLRWARASAPAGCLCTAASRIHKWGLALDAIHYTLARSQAAGSPTAR